MYSTHTLMYTVVNKVKRARHFFRNFLCVKNLEIKYERLEPVSKKGSNILYN